MTRTAFIGLGVMGYPMAGHLAGAGHEVCVYNRTTSKTDAWCNDHPGRWAETPGAAAAEADIVFSCVGNDDDVREVMLGEDGVIAGCRPGALIVVRFQNVVIYENA